MDQKKLIPLEAMRGFAAIIVLIHHFLLGFAPFTSGLLPQSRNEDSLVGQWYFFLFNGTSSVTFFFTLSGFVLCWSYFNSLDKNHLLKSFFKRWPRLSGLVVITTLSSYIMFKLGLFYYEPASSISNSSWLLNFGCPEPFCKDGWAVGYQANFVDAFLQGFTTFFSGDASYNTNLWTMKIEFIGSIITFVIAAFISLILSFDYLVVAFIIFSIWALSINIIFLPFIVGIFLSAVIAKYKTKVCFPIAFLFITIGIYLLSYLIPEKDFAWVAHINYLDISADKLRVIINTLASTLIIFSIMANELIFSKINGRISLFLGKLSFPLYLVHTLVICSVSSFVFILMHRYIYSDLMIFITTFFVTLLSSVIISLPLIYIDDFWLRNLNDVTRKLFHPYTTSTL